MLSLASVLSPTGQGHGYGLGGGGEVKLVAASASEDARVRLNTAGLLARLRTWEWSVRRERLIRRSVEVAASQLPLVSVMALFWLGIRLLQEKVEREHRREQEGGDYEYFDIIRWP